MNATTETEQKIPSIQEVGPMKVKGFGMVMHMSMAKSYHGVYNGEIIWPGNILHIKTIVYEYAVPRGKAAATKKGGSHSFYLKEKDSPEFQTIQEFINHYTPKPNP
jgi:hypothetical protein